MNGNASSQRADAKRVVVIDDDLSVRESLAGLLDSAAISATFYESAEQFLEMRGCGDVACLVSDVVMPGISGLELHRKLLEEGFSSPIIFISANSEDALCAPQNGVLVALQKPFDGEELLQWINIAINPLPFGS